MEARNYRGVSYRRQDCTYTATCWGNGVAAYLGRFNSAKQAAEAYDKELRRMCPDDKFKLSTRLNFPSEEEAAFQESPQQARQRGLSKNGSNHRKEARSFQLFMRAFASSKYSDKYEIVRLSGASRADALFKIKGSGQSGTCIQLKAATSRGSRGDAFFFLGLLGYNGMPVVFVALDGDHIWAASGRQLSANGMTMTIGSERDYKWRVSDIGSVLALCFHDVQEFPHMDAVLNPRLL